MKRCKLFFLFLLLVTLGATGQTKFKDILVDVNTTATLKFDDDIRLVIIANNPKIAENEFQNYQVFQDGKTCIISVKKLDIKKSSITVKLMNGDIYYSTVDYGEGDIFYHISNKKPNEKSKEELEMEKEENVIAGIKEKLDKVLELKPEYTNIGLIQSKLEIQVANIVNDSSNTYFSIIIYNGSGSDYIIDDVLFKYEESKSIGFKKDEGMIKERILPTLPPDKSTVKAYTTEKLGYVIPRFSIGKRGELKIHIKEKDGTRSPEIEIDGTTMLGIKVFQES